MAVAAYEKCPATVALPGPKPTPFLLRSRRSLATILSTKTVLNWGVEMSFCTMPSTGPRFKTPSLPEIEADQDKHGAMRCFDRDALLPAIHHADERMLVVILLGVNCAFYPRILKRLRLTTSSWITKYLTTSFAV